ncbi:hypothetical protein CF15_05625 [Pyrodictium occultum]|uniref:UPF0282 protein CF15_05625 n=2 Tax=Pyrodictium occultum TaxID=2309 RepID=A0A0V8RXF9_PYROC|nr:hypothetical protein CF15_05625 [Pyrodictium occultum]
MATVVEAGGVKIFIDPGVSYAPRRYGLPPHPLEIRRLEEIKERIYKELEDTDIVVITHYHYDHYLYRGEEAELYRGKVLLVKHPTRSINVSQRIRAHRLLKGNRVAELARQVIYLDGSTYRVDQGLEIRGSPPVPHGPDGTKLGYVVMVLVECCGYRFVHGSDVQGPISARAMEILQRWSPELVFISGPPTYFEGYKVDEESVAQGLRHLEELARAAREAVVADHHFARDLEYPSYLEDIRSRGGRVLSAAEFMGVEYEPFEALRRDLWRRSPEAADSDRAS